MAKLPTFFGKFCKVVKTFHFSCDIIFWVTFIDIWQLFTGHTDLNEQTAAKTFQIILLIFWNVWIVLFSITFQTSFLRKVDTENDEATPLCRVERRIHTSVRECRMQANGLEVLGIEEQETSAESCTLFKTQLSLHLIYSEVSR